MRACVDVWMCVNVFVTHGGVACWGCMNASMCGCLNVCICECVFVRVGVGCWGCVWCAREHVRGVHVSICGCVNVFVTRMGVCC